MKMSVQTRNYFRFIRFLDDIDHPTETIVGKLDADGDFTFKLEGSPNMAYLLCMENVTLQINIVAENAEIGDDSEVIIPIRNDVTDDEIKDILRDLIINKRI